MNDSTNTHRLHGLDFCRATFMLLGLFFHVGLIYGTDANWRVDSEQTSIILGYTSSFIHTFRMEAFYLISGFFYMLVYAKGTKNFLTERVIRALIPLVFCGLLINPFMNIYSYNNTYEWDSSYIIDGFWLGHLWFLGNLLTYFLLTYPLCRIIMNSKPLGTFSGLLSFYIFLPLASYIAYRLSFFLPERFIFITFSTLLQFYCFFLLGCFCYRNKSTFLALLNIKYLLVSIAIFSVLTLIPHISYLSNDILIKIAEKFSIGSLILLTISFVYIIGCKDSPVIRSLSDASYTIYLLHQPLIIFFYVLIFEKIQLGAAFEYFLLIASVFTTSFLFHSFIVKRNWFLKFAFNGILPRNRTTTKEKK